MEAIFKDFGLQGGLILITMILSVIANRRIHTLEAHDADQDVDHLELVFEMYESGTLKSDFVKAFIQRKRGMEHTSKSNLSDLLESFLS